MSIPTRSPLPRPAGRGVLYSPKHSTGTGLTAAALVDLSGFSGLQGQGLGQLNTVLLRQLQAAGLRAQLLRSLCYLTSDGPAQPGFLPDIVLRCAAHSPSGSASERRGLVARAIAQDLSALVSSGRVDVILLATDDASALTAAIDSAQLSGCRLVLLTPPLLGFPSLPCWVQAADRWVQADLPSLCRGMAGHESPESPSPELSPEELEARVQRVIEDWWSDLYEDDQEDIRDELHGIAGLPSDVDRDLLRLLKLELGRSLSFDEKKMLRARAREHVFGEDHDQA